MLRVKDVDTIAPDEVEVAKPQPKPKSKPKETSPSSPKSDSNAKFRQRIFEILGETKHPLSSFLVSPKIFNFEERDLQEEIILVMRRHWFTNVSWLITAVVMLFVPGFFSYVPLLASFPVKYQIAVVIFWYLFNFIFAFEKFLSWYFNVFIITDERVIDIDFNNLLDKKFSEAKISMIQDVTSHVSGLSQTLFNYGTVYIQTASEIPEIEFEKVANPDKVIKVLQQLRQEEELEAIEGRVR